MEERGDEEAHNKEMRVDFLVCFCFTVGKMLFCEEMSHSIKKLLLLHHQ